MKQFKMRVADSGFAAGTILQGPYGFNANQSTGYCQTDQSGNPILTLCFFKSYVEDRSDVFEEIKAAE